MTVTKARKGERRRRELALIHIARQQLGIDKEDYRKIIRSVGKVASCSAADLDAGGRQDVIRHLKSLGFRPIHKSARASGMHIRPSWERERQLSKICALLADLGYPWSYADAIAKRMYGVDLVRFLYPYQLQGVIAALVKRQKKGGDSKCTNMS